MIDTVPVPRDRWQGGLSGSEAADVMAGAWTRWWLGDRYRWHDEQRRSNLVRGGRGPGGRLLGMVGAGRRSLQELSRYGARRAYTLRRHGLRPALLWREARSPLPRPVRFLQSLAWLQRRHAEPRVAGALAVATGPWLPEPCFARLPGRPLPRVRRFTVGRLESLVALVTGLIERTTMTAACPARRQPRSPAFRSPAFADRFRGQRGRERDLVAPLLAGRT